MVKEDFVLRNEKKRLSGRLYILGLIIVFISAYSQYFFNELNPIIKFILVYGIPIVTISFLWGSQIIKKAFRNTALAIPLGLGFYGLFTLIGIILATVIYFFLLFFDPSSINLLHKPNPVIHVSSEFAWWMIVVSFLLVGPIEEYIFRGFVYGGLINIFKGRHWFFLAVISGGLFAIAHLYYAEVYGIASLVQFTDITFFGISMAVTYYFSGGNLIIPAVIHGAYDATGFLGVATNSDIGMYLREMMLIIGLIIAFIIYVQRKRKKYLDLSPESFS
jgi:membrane protease YdiL (CAAX protease family)